ncbi:MAG: hypothetical protein E7523_12130 [Ruminococcaceae bacterium]|nr:hypothetical protein [Oscillospiraceae bacterium]
MQEYLNDKEQEVLVWLGNRYLKYYETEMDIPDHDFDVFEGRAIDITQNILKGLVLRNYISFGQLYLDSREPAHYVYLKEKALNLFNSDDFKIMKLKIEKGLPTE